MNAHDIHRAMLESGHIPADTDTLIADLRLEAEFSLNSFQVRGLCWEAANQLEEIGWIIQDGIELGEPELDEETKARMEHACPQDYVGEEVVE